ncbi:unnamed protein product, partial [Amoebophrya sp. A25]
NVERTLLPATNGVPAAPAARGNPPRPQTTAQLPSKPVTPPGGGALESKMETQSTSVPTVMMGANAATPGLPAQQTNSAPPPTAKPQPPANTTPSLNKAAMDADLSEAKWMANHIQRHMAAQSSSSLQVDRLTREVERLKAESAMLRQEVASEKHKATIWQEQLQQQEGAWKSEKSSLERHLKGDKDRETQLQAQIRELQENCQAQVEAFRNKEALQSEYLDQVRGEVEKQKRSATTLEAEKAELRDQLQKQKRESDDALRELQGEKDRAVWMAQQDESTKLVEKEAAFEKTKADLDERVRTLESHLQRTRVKVAEYETQIAEAARSADVDRARTETLRQALTQAEEQNKLHTLQLDQTRSAQQADTDQLQHSLSQERLLREEKERALLAKESEYASLKRDIDAKQVLLREEQERAASQLQQLGDRVREQQNVISQRDHELAQERAMLTQELEQTRSQLQEDAHRERRALQENTQMWQGKYEALQRRVETDTQQTRDDATKEIEELTRRVESSMTEIQQ